MPRVTAPPLPISERALRRVRWRLLPFLGLLYVVAYLDRVNVSFAKLTMNADIGINDATYAFGAGIFFIGYFVFEIPSNLMLERVGARRWIARILMTWGVIAAGTAFVTGASTFVVMRAVCAGPARRTHSGAERCRRRGRTPGPVQWHRALDPSLGSSRFAPRARRLSSTHLARRPWRQQPSGLARPLTTQPPSAAGEAVRSSVSPPGPENLLGSLSRLHRHRRPR